MTQYISALDYVLLIIFAGIIYLAAYQIRNKLYKKNNPVRSYFIPALSVKLFGAVFIGLIYAYYYKGGDTFNYFHDALIVNSSLKDSFGKWWLLMRHADPYEPAIYEYTSQMHFYADTASFNVSRLAALFSLLCFNTYFPTALLFAALSFSGVWAMYMTFYKLKPHLHKYLAYSFLFIPSVFIWGSSIFKDTISLFGLGWLIYFSVNALVFQRKIFANILLSIIMFIIVATTKIYIAVAFLPSLVFWIFFTKTKQIGNYILRVAVNTFIIIIGVTALLFLAGRLEKQLGKYSLVKIYSTAEETRGWISSASGEEGSRYDLGTIEPGLTGFLAKAPAAINVTLFRPYLWESNKPIVLLSAIESFLFLIFTLYVLWKVGFKSFFSSIFNDPHVRFCILFALIFSFAVGISSYNFGALSRYKIPGIPFYAAGLVLILDAYRVRKLSTISPLQRNLYPSL